MVDNEHRDEQQLAEFTDRLLSGQDVSSMEVTEDMAAEARIVQHLRDLMQPDEPIDPAFRESLTLRLNEEWNRREKQRPRTRKVIPFYQRRQFQIATAAAAVVIMVIAAVLLNMESDPDPGGTAGTVDGSLLVFIAVATVGLLSALGFYLWGRRQ